MDTLPETLVWHATGQITDAARTGIGVGLFPGGTTAASDARVVGAEMVRRYNRHAALRAILEGIEDKASRATLVD